MGNLLVVDTEGKHIFKTRGEGLEHLTISLYLVPVTTASCLSLDSVVSIEKSAACKKF